MDKSELIEEFDVITDDGRRLRVGVYQEWIVVPPTLGDPVQPDMPGLKRHLILGTGQAVSIDGDKITAIGIGNLTRV